MTNILDPRFEEYLLGLLPEPDPVQAEMEALAAERRFPIVGPLVGRLLELLTRVTGARKILEMGSGFGYSAFWFARALPEDGEVLLTERDPADVELARGFLTRAGLARRCRFLTGEALSLASGLPGPFDIALIDVDKEQYPSALDIAVERIRSGGLLIADNALWHGHVIEPGPHEASTEGILEFNRRIHAHPRLRPVMVPLRDGLAICEVS